MSELQPTSDGAKTGSQGCQRHLRASMLPVWPHLVDHARPPEWPFWPRGL